MPVDLQAAAADAMRAHGFDPEFAPQVLQEVAALEAHPPAIGPGDGVRDLRHLPWSSIDNDTSRDLDQLEVAERLPDGATQGPGGDRRRGRVRAGGLGDRRPRGASDHDRLHRRQNLSDAARGAVDRRDVAARRRGQPERRHRVRRRVRRRRAVERRLSRGRAQHGAAHLRRRRRVARGRGRRRRRSRRRRRCRRSCGSRTPPRRRCGRRDTATAR